ncbi:nuclear transport factor 2 family protein [Pseudofrankia saprophytica]|uniref:nuclear transport factor 2 family protein n=1 Tax=Pseudofrankia saprophytica TaxID=298655 RepID=UPI000234B843|nr:nuclear transport factor 2 family protein [Pseudofrankia saprophytica]
MSDAVTKILQRYIEVFNETDDAARAVGIAEVFTEDALYTDPTAEVAGRDGINAYIGSFRKQAPQLIFVLGAVKFHHDTALFDWTAGPDGGSPVASGRDFVLLKDGQIERIHGFFD